MRRSVAYPAVLGSVALLLLLLALLVPAPALAGTHAVTWPRSRAGDAWGSPSGAAFAPAVTASALAAPACDDNWTPEAVATIPYFDAPNGNLLGHTTWTPNWEDTPGWHSVEIESPVWIDLTGGWSAGVPTASTNACIPAGSEVVQYGPFGSRFFDWAPNDDRTKTGAAEVGTLQIAAGAALELTNDSNNNQAHLAAFGDVYNDGTITLNNFYGLLSESGDAPGTIYNAGTITTAAGNGSAYIYGSIDNTGSFNVNGNTNLDPGGSDLTFANTGTINIAAGQALDIAPADSSVVFNLNGGTISNSGTFYQHNGTFNHTAGAASGNPLMIDNADLLADPSTGSADITVNNGTDTLTGDVGAGDTLTVTNSNGGLDDGYLTSATGVSTVTNAGTIALSSGSQLNLAGLTNSGTLTATGGEINGNFVNTGIFDVNGSVEMDWTTGGGDTITNSGTLSIAAGQSLQIGADSFDFTGGTIINDGGFHQDQGAFSHSAGTATGNQLEVDDANLSADPSSGSASLLVGNDTLTNGTIAAGETLGVSGGNLGDGSLTDVTNKGTISLGDGCALNMNVLTNDGTLDAGSGMINVTFDNNGTFNAAGTLLAVFNQSAGTTTVATGYSLTVSESTDVTGGTLVNNGTFAEQNSPFALSGGTITNNGTLAVQSSTFTLEGGTIANNGDVGLSGSTFDQQAGTATGNPLEADGATLNLSPSAGSVSFAADYSTVTLKTGVPAADTLTLAGNGNEYFPMHAILHAGAFTNAGTIVLSGGEIDLTGVLTNSGSLAFETYGEIKGSLTNAGAVRVNGNTELEGGYTQTAAGSLSVPITGVGDQYGFDIAANMALDGTLVLEPSSSYAGAAALGDDDYFISYSGSPPSGQFATVTVSPPLAGGLTFSIDYTDRASGFPDVSAVVAALAVPFNTSAPTITGSPMQGLLLTTNRGSWTNSPTSFTYQWLDCDIAGANCSATAAPGSSRTYAPTAADVGHTLRVLEVAANGAGPGAAASSVATAIVAAAATISTTPASTPPASLSPPTISGATTVGNTLGEQHGSWSNGPTGYSYQWYRCAGASCSAITGATAQGYTLTSADAGYTLRVAETATNAAGASSPANSLASAVIVSATSSSPSKPLAPTATLTARKISSSARSAKFTFKASGKSSGFQCALVRSVKSKGKTTTPAPSYGGCTSPKTYRNLKAGKYVFYVRAVGPGGSGAAAVDRFTIA